MKRREFYLIFKNKVFLVIGILLILTFLISGCALTEEEIESINQKIADKYNSASTFQYTVTETFSDGTKRTYTEYYKKPDMLKRVTESDTAVSPSYPVFVCKENSFIKLTKESSDAINNLQEEYRKKINEGMDVVEAKKWYAEEQAKISTEEIDVLNEIQYINLSSGIDSYCSWDISNRVGGWLIPMGILDESKYNVEMSEDSYNGKNVIRTEVTHLITLAPETIQKMQEQGLTIAEPEDYTIIYLFDPNDFSIIKEIYPHETTLTEEYSTGTYLWEREYENFVFNENIPDSEFDLVSQYPNVKYKKQVVDLSGKLGEILPSPIKKGIQIYDEDFSEYNVGATKFSEDDTISWYLDPWDAPTNIEINEENNNKYLRLGENSPQHASIYFSSLHYIISNFAIESKIRLNSGNLNFKFAIREKAHENNNWEMWVYQLEMNNENLKLVKTHYDSRTDSHEREELAETLFDVGNWHTIKVYKINNQIKVDIDGENRIDFTDSNPYDTQGTINFNIPNGQADLDDWKIFDLDHDTLNHNIETNIHEITGDFRNVYSCGHLSTQEDTYEVNGLIIQDPNFDVNPMIEFTGLFKETEPIAQRLKNTDIKYWHVRGIGNRGWMGDGIYITQDENGNVNLNFSELDPTIDLIKALGKEPFIRLGYALPLFMVNCTRPGCTLEYECTDWGECNKGNPQFRECTVTEDCGDPYAKPLQKRECGTDAENVYDIHPNQEVVGCAPRDYSQWEEIIYQIVKHYNIDRGDNIKYWVVWNEPDLPEYGGDYGNNIKDKENYFKLYEHAVKGALRADPTIKIGGPAIAGGAYELPSEGNEILEGLIDYCAQNNIRLDFIDFHRYIDPMNSQHPSYYQKLVNFYKNLALKYGLNPEIMITESGMAGGGAGSSAGIKDEKTASFLISMIHYQLKGGVDLTCSVSFNDGLSPLLTIKDCLYAQKGFAGMPFIVRNQFLTADFYTYDILTELSKGKQQLRVSINGGDDVSDENSVGSLATKADDGTVRILVWRYETWRGLDKKIELSLNGIGEDKVTVDTYLIDKTHNNPLAECLENPGAFGPNIEEPLEKLSSQTINVINGRISLPLNLEDYSVMLIKVRTES